MKTFPEKIREFADVFVTMQEKRHRADYDPHERYYKSSVEADISAAEAAIAAFEACELKDRRAFAVHIVIARR